MILALEVQAYKRGVKMTVSYKTMQKNKKLDEFEEKKEEEDEEKQD